MNFNSDQTTVKVPLNGISAEGKRIAENLLAEWKLPSLPTNWDWQWKVNGKGEYVGTFPKRVAKYLYQKHETKLSADRLGVLGSKVAEHCERNASYTFDFTDSFDWSAGDFGDDGSCFWGGRSDARDMLTDNGARAVRFYKDGSGYARAWIAEIAGGVVIFNGYGLESLQIARILAHHWGAYYKKVSLENNGEETGTLWINGGVGFVVGSQDTFEGVDSVDLRFEDTGGYRCDNCSERIDDDYARHADDGVYCESCFDSLYFYCEDCEDSCSNDDYNNINDRAVCDGCRQSNYTECEDCNNYVADDAVCIGPDNCSRCEDCHSNAVGFCEDCEEDCMAADMESGPDGEARCEDCHAENVAPCEDCEEDCMVADMESGPDGEARCEDCHTEMVGPCEVCAEENLRADMADDCCAACQKEFALC